MERVEDDGYIEMLDASKSVQNLASLEKYRKLTFDARVCHDRILDENKSWGKVWNKVLNIHSTTPANTELKLNKMSQPKKPFPKSLTDNAWHKRQ